MKQLLNRTRQSDLEKKQKSEAVIELQRLACDRQSDIYDTLRVGLMIFEELNVPEMVTLIEKEQVGYALTDELPQYRQVPFHIGVQPIGVFHQGHGVYGTMTGFAALPSTYNWGGSYEVRNSIGELASHLVTHKPFYFPIPEDIEEQVKPLVDYPSYFAYIVGRNSIESLLEQIKNQLVSAASKLKKAGVLGEGWKFTDMDREKIQTVQQFGFINITKVER